MDDAARDQLARGWNSAISTLDDVGFRGRGDSGPMSPVSRGFRHLRRASDEDADRVPPGQYVTDGFPVLSAGPTPHTPLGKWTFSITQGGQTRKSWTW